MGAWVDELGACWRTLLPPDARPILVNLDGVTFVDAAGKALLRAMHADGAILASTNVVMRAMVDEINGGTVRDRTMSRSPPR